MRILILEDEIPASKKLVAYLNDYFSASAFLKSVRTVKDGIQLLNNDSNYDLILADIKLLDGSSFKIFQEVETKIPIIFCTAYDEHLLQAFQINGIAYILKPYDKKDLEVALKKFQKFFEPKTLDKGIFEKLKEVLGTKDENYKKRFAIKKRDGIKLLDATQISLIQANGDFCKIVDSKGYFHSISKNIGVLAEELNPTHFFKINRSQIVSLEYIEKINPYSKNRLALSIKGVKEHAITSTSTTKEFRKWLEN